MVNKAIILGNLGKDPDLRFTAGGRAVARFPVATTERWTDQNNQRQEHTEWHNIVVWGKQAETCSQYLSKGRQVYVEGSIRTRSYEKDGTKRYMTEIVARDVRFLGGAGGGGQGRAPDGGFTPPPPEEGPPPMPPEEDTPF